MEAFGAVLWARTPKACGILMYPLQLLTGNVPLAAILGILVTTLQLATVGRELMSTASPPTVLRDASTPSQN